MRTHMYTASRKNMTLINFAQSHTQSLVSIDFSCNVLEFQNTGHSQSFSLWEVVGARFREENSMVINIAQNLILNSFSCTVLEFQNTCHSQRISP
ncbi:hypothetical protein BHE74_00039022 [Ensete ventricosum]|nr:hypothetical protein GW17_00062305 [Ensete ventricosum]RWW54399.1 hypothetical protein BHE74_00039022 [Ensete ventricosum]RZS11925.1 hypothetical protein BHM03_00043290 [Ensete ventricosum]